MPVGVETYSPTGVPWISLMDRVGRVIGIVAGNQAGGSFSDPSLAQGDAFAFIMFVGSITLASQTPQITVSGTTISYSASSAPFFFVYGTY